MADSVSKKQEIFEIKEKVSSLEQMMMRLLFVQQKTEMGLQSLQREMKDFKDEMKDFKDEMKDFKDEMRGFKDEMNKKWGELANKMGTVVEDIVAPNIHTIAKQYFGCEEIDELLINSEIRSKKDRGKIREFDVVASFNNKVILNETKSTVRKIYIDSFIAFIESQEFYDYFPRFKGRKLIPIFSSLSIKDKMLDLLTKNKIYCMVMKGNTMDLINYSAIEKKESS